MFGNDTMETASTEVTSIRYRNNVEKSTLRTHRYFVDFKSRIHVGISTSNRCHNFHVDSPFKIDVISTNFPRGISTSNRWRINGDVSIGLMKAIFKKSSPRYCIIWKVQKKHKRYSSSFPWMMFYQKNQTTCKRIYNATNVKYLQVKTLW